MLTTRPRAKAPVTELDVQVDETLEAVLCVVPFDRLLAAVARFAERRRLMARGSNSRVEQTYDVVQGRLELAVDDLKSTT